jgi:hypothetical protein
MKLVEFKVVGVSFGDFEQIKNEVQIAQQVIVEWEKDNKYDPCAHVVKINDLKVGYIPKHLVQELNMEAPFYVRRFTHFDGERVGFNVVQVVA